MDVLIGDSLPFWFKDGFLAKILGIFSRTRWKILFYARWNWIHTKSDWTEQQKNGTAENFFKTRMLSSIVSHLYKAIVISSNTKF